MCWAAISFALIFLDFFFCASCSGAFYQKVSDDGNKADVATKGFHHCSMRNNCNYLGIPTKDNDNKVYSSTTKKELQGTEKNLQIWKKMAPERSAEKESSVNEFKSCKEAMKNGIIKSGVVQLTLANNTKIDVFCDMLTDGGGWIVFQRRTDNQTSFERNWQDYENGFGSLNSSFWLGLKAMHNLTASGNWTLRVDLQASDGDKGYAQYTDFSIGGKQANYSLEYEKYAGNVGDSLTVSKGFPFSTFDQDNDSWDKNCALVYQGAWWHSTCFKCNLNNVYPGTANKIVQPPNANMMSWYTWKTDQRYGNIIFSEMKIREGTSG